ncbi:unnamed protein product [Amaranthus hypochondriacus]
MATPRVNTQHERILEAAEKKNASKISKPSTKSALQRRRGRSQFVVNHGASAILSILILAEVTSPLQNIWSLASLRKTTFPSAKWNSMANCYSLFSIKAIKLAFWFCPILT